MGGRRMLESTPTPLNSFPPPRSVGKRVLSLFIFAWGFAGLVGIVWTAWRVSAFEEIKKGLPGTHDWFWRNLLSGSFMTGFWAAAVFAFAAAIVLRSPGTSRLRRRRVAPAVLVWLASIAALLALGTWWARERLSGPMAQDLELGVVFSKIVCPTLFDPQRIPRAAVAAIAAALFWLAWRVLRPRRATPSFSSGQEFSREFRAPLGRLGAAMLVGCVVVFMSHRPTPPPRNRPDIILISIDTLRADHLPLYGYDRDTSPHLRTLAKDGVVVADAVSHAPWTLPTHVAMFTGRLPFEHGVTGLENVLSLSIPTLGEVVKNEGYATGAIVANHLLSPVFGYSRGFDWYVERLDAPADRIINEAVQRLRTTPSPRLVFVHLYDPHFPYDPPADLRGRFGRKDDGLDEWATRSFFDFAEAARGFDEERVADVIGRYDEEILAADRAVGVLLGALRSEGAYDQAWIIVTSDHGEEFADHGLWGHSVTLYEEMLRVPLLIKPPGKVCAGTRSAGASFEQRSIFSLVTAIASGALPQPVTPCGEDDMPVFLKPWLTDGPVFAETEVFGDHRFATRTSASKLIEPYAFETGSFSVKRDYEFFDLSKDPYEANALDLGASPKALRDALNDVRGGREKALADRDADAMRKLDPVERRDLQALGYLQ